MVKESYRGLERAFEVAEAQLALLNEVEEKAYDRKERDRARDKKYYENNREKILKRRKAHYAANREEMREKNRVYGKMYYANNREKLAAKARIRSRPYYEKNREKVKAKSRAHYYTKRIKKMEKILTKDCESFLKELRAHPVRRPRIGAVIRHFGGFENILREYHSESGAFSSAFRKEFKRLQNVGRDTLKLFQRYAAEGFCPFAYVPPGYDECLGEMELEDFNDCVKGLELAKP